ncbi:hypothetical protein L1987_14227 [Smallanthus sonchifolius]|uniref:Uncharacterized protein n=1 Tax=Smallanthus sonchifolius TaxID=185202 RepID=A0ACB9J5Q3_9ASTR|nr:hypothetical protein L1987_14227 [Smallanthus sonchifolius]
MAIKGLDFKWYDGFFLSIIKDKDSHLYEGQVVEIGKGSKVKYELGKASGLNKVGGRKVEYIDTDIDGLREKWSTFVSNFIFR